MPVQRFKRTTPPRDGQGGTVHGARIGSRRARHCAQAAGWRRWVPVVATQAPSTATNWLGRCLAAQDDVPQSS